MPQNPFTAEELLQLVEALKVWEREPMEKGFSSMMMTTVLEAMLPKENEDKEARAARMRDESNRAKDKAEKEAAVRREQSIILQAKLIQLKNATLSE